LLPFLLSSYPFLLAFRPALICSTTPVALVRERERERDAHTHSEVLQTELQTGLDLFVLLCDR
jgi:hypothetical protein